MKAQVFRMPAMSPTMEKGGVTDWKFKEGDAFNSGDVLLEVETDKATIDVEAQDDGILAKILIQNGVKDIPVGEPIAILAEEDDDLANLELPELNLKSKTAPKKETEKEVKKEASKSVALSEGVSTKANVQQVFFPSVDSLLSENNISRDEALAKIPATGPQGRLLKGDVLAYLGKISKDSVNSIAAYINSHSKLDLSNIEKHQIKPKEVEQVQEAKEKIQEVPIKPMVEPLIKTFSLDNVLEFQREIDSPMSLKEYVEGASRRAERFAYQAHGEQSDFYDPIFEDLCSVPSTVDRFSIRLDIPTQNAKPLNALDIAEDLFSDPVIGSKNELTVTVTLNEKVVDSKAKALLYLSQLEKYLSV
jgi:pyruvate dehydrogenase E2 component (dihydrolipoamide acetyltransferase)